MFHSGDEGPVYYREIQKNAYLKRIPIESSGKLRPLGNKKQPLKPMWTLFCIHNGRVPFLEQYPEPKATLTHQPTWRVCLKTARHVTASVKPHLGEEYDFLVDTDHGPIRMLAPNWDSMQDWVSILRTKLHELRIVSPGENVYCSPPAALPPRAAARDPTSPLPPTPPVPPDRVPGIDLTPITRNLEPNTSDTNITNEAERNESVTSITNQPSNLTSLSNMTSMTSDINDSDVDISNWDAYPLPSTSRDDTRTIAKICGQNICLDDSILKRNVSESDEEFFNEIDEIKDDCEYKQRLVVSEGDGQSTANISRNNVTVIQVSNKTPHTAIPVLGENVFDFEFKQKLTIKPENNDFVNIVNTENRNSYGTVYVDDYRHVPTTVNLTGDESNDAGNVKVTAAGPSTDNNEVNVKMTDGSTVTDVNVNVIEDSNARDVNGLYERLCMASTSNRAASPLSIRKVINENKIRKSSLPNLDIAESTYEYLYPNNSNTDVIVNSNIERINVGSDNPNTRVIRSNIERSQSQNAYDISPRRRIQNNSPKRDNKQEKSEQQQQKPVWKRGLTELSLLSRLRGIGQKRQESPNRQEERVTSSVKVVHRPRTPARDNVRRRSSSLNNSPSPPGPSPLQPLRCRQAAALRADQGRGASVTSVRVKDAPLMCEYERSVWVARWGSNGFRISGRSGDRVAGIAGSTPSSLTHARNLIRNAHTSFIDILFHRVPLAKIYVINKRDKESLGIKLDNECTITSIAAESPASRAGLPAGRWAVTEVNNRPINIVKGGEEEMNRISFHGTEVSILIQPSGLVKKMRSALKGRQLLAIR
ncbi:unnamed protein product [Danaus chrysippus]|uniref:(African queen) hypothetical protein n=1 Tax=Danaus chrysippus TaxID=151541 RepID=A0A8J2R5L9_9NEOP|nr:unnamed protein product [Danaus chrysippus]